MSIHFVFDGREITGIDLIFYFLIDIRRIGLLRQFFCDFSRISLGIQLPFHCIPDDLSTFLCKIS